MGHDAAVELMAFEVDGGLRSRFWKKGSVARRDGLPLLLLGSPLQEDEVDKVVDVMSVAVSQLLGHLHHVTKHLEFWQRLSKVMPHFSRACSCTYKPLQQMFDMVFDVGVRIFAAALKGDASLA